MMKKIKIFLVSNKQVRFFVYLLLIYGGKFLLLLAKKECSFEEIAIIFLLVKIVDIEISLVEMKKNEES